MEPMRNGLVTTCMPEPPRVTPDVRKVANQIEKLYVSYYDRFVIMNRDGSIFIPKIGNRTMILAKSNLVKHVMCEYAISVYADKEGSKFLCFDVDQGGQERTQQVIGALEQLGVPREMIHVSFSGGKGYHVEVFFDAVVRTKHLLRVYKQVIHVIDATNHEVEFRPLHKMAIKLPLSCHHRTGNRCWFLDRESFEAIRDVGYVFGIVPFHADALVNLVEQIPLEAELPAEIRKAMKDSSLDITQCDASKVFAPLAEPGTRHQRMVQMAVYLRHCGADSAACADALTHWYLQQSLDFVKSTEQEVMREIRGIVKWVQSEHFHSVASRSNVVYFSLQDMQWVMSHEKSSDKKVHFMLLVLIKTWRTLTQEKIGAILGLTRETVGGSIKRLTEADSGIIVKEGQVIRQPDGNLTRKANCYALNKEPRKQPANSGWISDRFHTLVSAEVARKRFNEAFYGAVHDIFGGCDLKRLLLPREYKEYRRYVHCPLKKQGGITHGFCSKTDT